MERGLLGPVPEVVVVVTVRSALSGFADALVVGGVVFVLSVAWVEVFVCAESVERGLSVLGPVTAVLATLRSLAAASPAELLEFS
ncbi:hypothetical protein [Mycobacterium sp. 141]|uniref:hypothetical protein n=1 Tax=Mycobacterium sp. 141 TaxID=1120797 RepID=UPI0018CAF9B8|nr:hypothetical protein [Mycobacterium sp. 141]